MWEDKLIVTIWGKPAPMGRHRCSKAGYAYMAPNTRRELARITTACVLAKKEQRHETIEKHHSVMVQCLFLSPLPKAAKHTEKRTFKRTKPDLDNLNKMILDACTKAQIWRDDSQVVSLTSEKYYCSSLEEAKTIVRISIYTGVKTVSSLWDTHP
tara:strand:- start:678 stop:1142 length:465 start_codon:yes stop_codon:yes gene_type:complete